MKTIRIQYQNMWGNSNDFPANYLHECFPFLRGHFNFVLSDQPRFVFYSVYGKHLKTWPGAIRCVYSGEAGDWFHYGGKTDPIDESKVDPAFWDYGIACARTESARPERHLFFPQGFLHLGLYNDGIRSLVAERPPNTGEFFCNFIYSNDWCKPRIAIMEALARYKRIECCGKIARNNDALLSAGHGYNKAGYLAKQAFQHRCRFSLAIENNHTPGYSTEKMTDALLARSVPIYSGDPRIAEVFNPAAFINLDEFATLEEGIEYVKMVDQNERLYRSYVEAPAFIGNRIPEEFTDARLLAFWRRMLDPL